MKAVLLVSHGSRHAQTRHEVQALLDAIQKRGEEGFYSYAFLELQQPTIPEGLERCVAQGAGHVLVLLNFLNAGRHVNEDIPAMVRAAAEKYPQVRFEISSPVGQHPDIVGLFLDMITKTGGGRGQH